MTHAERYKQWLADGGYRPRTVAVYSARVASFLDAAHAGEDPPPHNHNNQYAARSYLTFLAAKQLAEDAAVFTFFEKAAAGPDRTGQTTVQQRRGKQTAKRRQMEARSVSDDDWRRLHSVITEWASRRPTPVIEAAVIHVLMDTGLRVSDVLGITRKALEHGVEHGSITVPTKGGETRTLPFDGAPEAWSNLLHAWRVQPGRTVMELVAPNASKTYYGGHPAYTKVASYFKEKALAAGVAGRIHLHRLRRTVAVQSLRVEKDIMAVKELLGHDSLKSTERYLDEARPDDVAQLQRNVRKRFTE